jgi:hypothetical protein
MFCKKQSVKVKGVRQQNMDAPGRRLSKTMLLLDLTEIDIQETVLSNKIKKLEPTGYEQRRWRLVKKRPRLSD